MHFSEKLKLKNTNKSTFVQVGGLPCPTPSCKPAVGTRKVKTRLEEPGGGWRSEVLNKIFLLANIYFRSLLVCCGLAVKITN